MSRFYPPTLSTCLISNLVVTATLILPILVYHFTGGIIFTGVMLILTISFILKSNLCKSSVSTVEIEMSGMGILKKLSIIAIAFVLHAICFVIAANFLLTLGDLYDTARTITALAFFIFIPSTLFIISSPLKD